jgi:DNA-binding Lrp family transcriptional regulator
MAHDVQLDAVDHAVLAALARDGRMSMNELAAQVGVSRATAYTRVERLRRERVITGFTATIDPARAGFGVTALILLNVRQADWQAARDLLLAVPGVVYLAMTSGAFDMVMLVRAADERTKPNTERLREYTDAALPRIEQQLYARVPIYSEVEVLTMSFSLQRMREWLGPDHPVLVDLQVHVVLAEQGRDILAGHPILEHVAPGVAVAYSPACLQRGVVGKCLCRL